MRMRSRAFPRSVSSPDTRIPSIPPSPSPSLFKLQTSQSRTIKKAVPNPSSARVAKGFKVRTEWIFGLNCGTDLQRKLWIEYCEVEVEILDVCA